VCYTKKYYICLTELPDGFLNVFNLQKGQLISKCRFGVTKSTKKPNLQKVNEIFVSIFCPTHLKEVKPKK
jgi:hypothetical protein